MLNCREISERASDYLDGSLPWMMRMHVRIHLMMCRFCREYVRQLSLVVDTLSQLPKQRPDEQVQQSILAMFRSERS